MARKGITYDQVAEAANSIKARGIEPTIHGVRVELGNEGSFSTISQHLSKWRSEGQEAVNVRPMPPAVEEKVMEIAARIWVEAEVIAQTEVKQAQEELARSKKEWEAAEEKWLEEIEILETSNDELEIVREELLEALHKAKEKAANLEGQLAAQQEQIKQLLALVPKGADTTREHPAKTKAAPERTQAAPKQ